jgi:hypothetical protein
MITKHQSAWCSFFCRERSLIAMISLFQELQAADFNQSVDLLGYVHAKMMVLLLLQDKCSVCTLRAVKAINIEMI